MPSFLAFVQLFERNYHKRLSPLERNCGKFVCKRSRFQSPFPSDEERRRCVELVPGPPSIAKPSKDANLPARRLKRREIAKRRAKRRTLTFHRQRIEIIAHKLIRLWFVEIEIDGVGAQTVDDDDQLFQRRVTRLLEHLQPTTVETRFTRQENHQPVGLRGEMTRFRVKFRFQQLTNEEAVARADDRRRLLPLQMRSRAVLVEAIGYAERVGRGQMIVQSAEEIRVERVAKIVRLTRLPQTLNVDHRLLDVFDQRRAIVTGADDQ